MKETYYLKMRRKMQVSITFGSHDPTILCNFKEVHNCNDVVPSLPPIIIKFGDFEQIDVSKSLCRLSMEKAIMRGNSIVENKF